MESENRRYLLPLIAVSVVALLLVSVLYLYFEKPRPPAPATPVVESKPPTPTRPPETKPTDEVRRKEQEECAARVRQDLEKGDLDGAAKGIAQLRERGGREEADAFDRQLAEAIRKKKEEELAQADEAFRKEEDAIRKSKDEFRWDDARARLEAVEKAHPAVAQVSDFRKLRGELAEQAEEALRTHEQHLASAREALQLGRIFDAMDRVEQARSFYPERAAHLEPLFRDARDRVRKDSMVYVPAPPPGLVWTVGDDAHPDEAPKREFRRGDFFLDRTEVTNEQYLVFVRMTGHRPPRSLHWKGGKANPEYAQHPVTGVTAQDAADFSAWAGGRLPTSEEWEAASRWLDGRAYPWGDQFQPGEKVYLCNSLEQSEARNLLMTRPVGSYPEGKSPCGALDLAGNVWEWTSTTRPGEGGVLLQVCKGGSFMTRAGLVRSSNVYLEDPELAHHDIGFRCLKEPE